MSDIVTLRIKKEECNNDKLNKLRKLLQEKKNLEREITKLIYRTNSEKKGNDYIQNSLFNYLISNLCDNAKIDKIEINSIHDLINYKYPKKKQIKILNKPSLKKSIKMYENNHNNLKKKRKKMREMKREYQKLCNKIDSDYKTKIIRKTCGNIKSINPQKMYLGEQKVMKVLEKLRKKYEINYLHGYRLNFCKNQKCLEYDFMCILFYKDRVILFAIEYDGEQHYAPIKKYNYEATHKNDILKQFYLYNLNINLIRVNKKSNLSKTIKKFIKQLIKTKNYLFENPIKPKEYICKDKNEHRGIKIFKESYKNYNRLSDIK